MPHLKISDDGVGGRIPILLSAAVKESGNLIGIVYWLRDGGFGVLIP
jgi:hypothetical protein